MCLWRKVFGYDFCSGERMGGWSEQQQRRRQKHTATIKKRNKPTETYISAHCSFVLSLLLTAAFHRPPALSPPPPPRFPIHHLHTTPPPPPASNPANLQQSSAFSGPRQALARTLVLSSREREVTSKTNQWPDDDRTEATGSDTHGVLSPKSPSNLVGNCC